jgi:hypothetical protein
MRLHRREWALFLATAIVLAACQSFRAELEEAQQLRQAGEPDKARRVVLGIIEEKPRQTAAWLSLVETDLALAEKARLEEQPDSTSRYLWEAARVVMSHWAASRISQSRWKASATSVFDALVGDLKPYTRQMAEDTIPAASHLLASARGEARRLLRRVLLYRELLRRLPEPAPGDFSTLENQIDDITRRYTEKLKLDPRLRQDIAERLGIVMDKDFNKLLVARRQLGDIPLEVFLDMPLELYLK